MIDFDEVKSAAVGRWPGIFIALGIDVGDGRHTLCPVCHNGKKHFRMDDKDGRGTWVCTCGSGDGWMLIQEILGCDFKGAIEQVHHIVGSVEKSRRLPEENVNPAKLRDMFTNSSPICSGDIVGQYLASRSLSLCPQHCDI